MTSWARAVLAASKVPAASAAGISRTNKFMDSSFGFVCFD
jgi:hypothetical protein